VDALEPFASVVEQRFNLWLGREKKAGRDYTPEQEEWLRRIASFVAANAEITATDFMEAPSLSDKGGILKARKLFDPRFTQTLDDLQTALVA
jgi:type I restriction enzyme R subunit